ncbi:MAG: CPBP family intramembrane metalloprotease [Rhodocyclaceae bacterium]
MALLHGTEYFACLVLHELQILAGVHPGYISSSVVLLGNGILFSVLMHIKGMSHSSLFHDTSHSVGATLGVLGPLVLLLVPGLLAAEMLLQWGTLWLIPPDSQDASHFARLTERSPDMLLLTCVLAPILEEMLFRGIILRSFLQQYPARSALIASALLFGAAHLNPYQFVTASLMGYLSGWLYLRSRSLLPSIILHAGNNIGVSISIAMNDGNRTWMDVAWFGFGGVVVAWAALRALHRLLARSPAA